MDDDTFDIKKYELTDEHLASRKKARKARNSEESVIPSEIGAELEQEQARKRARLFIMVPMLWADRLRVMPRRYAGVTYIMALALLHRQWQRRARTFTLSNVAAAEIGLSAWEKWRAIKGLELLGLIKVERRKRRSPVITLITTETAGTSH